MSILVALQARPATLLASLLCLYVLRKIYVYTRLSQFRGPRFTGVSDWPHSLSILREESYKWYAQVNAKYGSVARVAPNILITSSPELWAHVNKQPGYKRSDWYYHAARIEYRRDNVFSQTDNEKHHQRRQQMMPGYSGRENLDLEPAIDERVKDLLHLIRSKYLSTTQCVVPVDLALKVQYFTLDVISGVGLGRSFGMLKNDSDIDEYLKSSEEGLAILTTSLGLGLSWLAQAPFIGRFIAPSPKDNNGFGRMIAACYRYVDERARNPTDKRSDMLASFIRHGLSGDELRSEALEQIIAGSDTTAGGIRGTLLHILTNPRVYAKLQREVDQAIEDGTAPAPGEGVISFTKARQLPYLQAVIREGLRIWPPVLNIFSRDVPPDGDHVQVDGKEVFLPGGICIGYSGLAIQHDKDVFGEDADAFRPERWFETDVDKYNRMLSVNDLVFGHGRFMCLGKPVAQIELSKVIFELMRNFDIAIMNPTQPWKARNFIGLFALSDMWVQVMQRGS